MVQTRTCVRQTACGPVRGLSLDGYEAYLGIRYAAAERWEQAVQAGRWEGEYDATHFGDRACQFRGFYGVEDSAINQFYYDEAKTQIPAVYSEDCLNLNIWTRADARDLPVLVYIHGGAFRTGGNGEPFVDGAAYVRRNVVMVSINYRLGPFHSAYGDGYTGNLALTDQMTALAWVRDNIADYGGAPGRVTVMGESAGAVSVQCLLLSPMAKGLFQGAVMMSGGGDLSALGTPNRPERVRPVWDWVKKSLGADTLQDLKGRPAYQVYSAWQKALDELPQYVPGFSKPVLGGPVLPAGVAQARAEGTVTDVPCIIGVLSADSWPRTLCEAALDYAAGQERAGGAPVYVYLFDRTPPGENPFGAFHGADLWYVFGTLDRGWRPYDQVDRAISGYLLNYIANFAGTGDPNGTGLPKWDSAGKNGQVLRLAEEADMCYPDLEQLGRIQDTASPYPYHWPNERSAAK